MHNIRDFPRADYARNISEEKSTMRLGLIRDEILTYHLLLHRVFT